LTTKATYNKFKNVLFSKIPGLVWTGKTEYPNGLIGVIRLLIPLSKSTRFNLLFNRLFTCVIVYVVDVLALLNNALLISVCV
jgi:hypothetical protein